MRVPISLRVYVLLPVALSLIVIWTHFRFVEMPRGMPLGLVLVPIIAAGIWRIFGKFFASDKMTVIALTVFGVLVSTGLVALEMEAMLSIVLAPFLIFFDTIFGWATFSMTLREAWRVAVLRFVLFMVVLFTFIRFNIPLSWLIVIGPLLALLAFFPRLRKNDNVEIEPIKQ